MSLNSFWIPVTHFKSHFLGLDITFLDSTHLSPIVKALLKVICKVWVGELACLFSLSYTPSCVFVVRPSPFCDPQSPVLHSSSFFNLIPKLLSCQQPCGLNSGYARYTFVMCISHWSQHAVQQHFSAFRLAWSGEWRGTFWTECFCSSVTCSYFQGRFIKPYGSPLRLMWPNLERYFAPGWTPRNTPWTETLHMWGMWETILVQCKLWPAPEAVQCRETIKRRQRQDLICEEL